jgi:hypothetical protein
VTPRCFGLRHDPEHPYCKVCDVFLRCKIATAERERREPGELGRLLEETPEPTLPIPFTHGSKAWAAASAAVRMTGEFSEKDILPL